MANSADPDLFRSQLILIYTVGKDRVYPGSAGQGLKIQSAYNVEVDRAAKVSFSAGQNHLIQIFLMRCHIFTWIIHG